MVDPFFQKANQNLQQESGKQTPSEQISSQDSNQAVTQVAQKIDDVLHQQQIQQLLQQQQLLEQQYNQLGSMLQNTKLPDVQKQQIYEQAQQISTQYQENNKKLESLGYNLKQVNKPTEVKNTSGFKLSIRGFLMGCFVLIILLVGGLLGIFYYLINNPDQLNNVGLDIETTLQLLQVFGSVFFGLIVFLGVGIMVVNGYRLISVKNQSKIGYWFGLLLGLILFVGGLFLGSRVIDAIGQINPDPNVDKNRLLSTYVYAMDSDPKGDGFTGLKYISTSLVSPIAPVIVSFELNADYFNRYVLPSLGQVSFDKIVLKCGNEQTILMNLKAVKFDDKCIYFNKGDYPLSLVIDYTNTPTGEKRTQEISAGSFEVKSEILVNPVDGTLSFNDAHTEMIVGKVPSKVRFDASSVFRDFGLMDYRIVWDTNGDGLPDKQDASTFTYRYKQAKLYPVVVTFPELTNYGYVFPLRVEQSDVPVCDVIAKNSNGSSYDFNVTFLESSAKIVEYQYSILNGGKSVASSKSKQMNFDYEFPSVGTYSLKVEFITDEGKKGSCESEDIEIGATDFQINYALKYKSPGSTKFVVFGQTGANSFSSDSVILSEMPTIIQLSLLSISPNNPNATRNVTLDGVPVLSTDGNKNFEFTIDSPQDHYVQIIVQDSTTNAKSQKTINFGVNRDVIIGRLLVKPDSVGISPFEVTFDASTTTLNDPKDEIIYFTWDFGDGTEIKKNMSKAIIKHTYMYSQKEDQGIFHPKVTVTTRKGIKKDIFLDAPIIIKKEMPRLSFILDSHPGQIAKVGDRVPVSLVLDGLPNKIYWNFGNGKTLECDGRSCITTSTLYETVGNYTIKARVIYADKPEAEGSINLKIIN